MAIDNHGAYTAPAELIGKHQPRGSGANNEDIGIDHAAQNSVCT
jgi:hypothetical protein